jgi:hypothetical protein
MLSERSLSTAAIFSQRAASVSGKTPEEGASEDAEQPRGSGDMSPLGPHLGRATGIGRLEVLAMKMRDVGISLLGGGMVYVAMAACSSGHNPGTAARGTGGGATAVSSGASGHTASGAGSDGGMMDALMDPVPSASADPTDGRRLKAQYMLGDDGSKAYVPGVWFDSMRNETCSFAPAADGMMRCLPEGVQSDVFSDAACTMPLLIATSGCAAPAYGLTTDSAMCSTTAGATHVYALGQTMTPTMMYVTSGTQCFPAGPPSTGFTFYGLGAEIPASSFVSASSAHD